MCGGGSCGRGNLCCSFVPKSTNLLCCSPCTCPMCPPPRACHEMCCEHPCCPPVVCHPKACVPCPPEPYRVRCFSFTSPPKWISTTVNAPCYQPACPRPTLLTYRICPTICPCPKTTTCINTPTPCC